MQQALARVRVLVLTATTAVFSVAAIATAVSGDVHKSIVTAILKALPAAERPEATVTEAQVPPTIVSIGETAVQTPDAAELRRFSEAEDLPQAGVLANRELGDPHNPDEPLLVFTPRGRPLAVAEVTRTAFAKRAAEQLQREIALARVPQAKPATVWSIPGNMTTPSPMMAYARAPDTFDEPFSAVLGLRSSVTELDDGHYRPRPRPDDTVLAAWLDGRSPAQFAEGTHDWLQNPLPADVYSQKQQKCLAEGIYFEARGEPQSGQAAVAQVILNRVRNPAYPNTICGVVYQNERRRHKCQFSFACDGHAEIIRSQRSWKVAQQIGRDVTDGKLWIDDVGDSTHYHANYVSPRWGRRMIRVDKIGAHIFYRTRFGGWS